MIWDAWKSVNMQLLLGAHNWLVKAEAHRQETKVEKKNISIET